MQPDPCQNRQKVCNDVSLHRLCRYGGQDEEQTERGETHTARWRERGGEHVKQTEGWRVAARQRGDRDWSQHRETEQV